MAERLNFGIFLLHLTFILLFLVIVYFLLYYLLYTRQIKRWKESNIPFLQPTFFFGHRHFLSMLNNPAMVAIEKIYKEDRDKGLLGFFMGTLPVILIRDPKLINHVLVKNSSRTFGIGYETPEFEVEAEHMIFTSTNKTTWKLGRTVMSPMFSPTRLAGSRFVWVQKEILKLLQHGEQAYLSDQTLNITNLSHDYAFNAFTFPNFGIISDSEEAKTLVKLTEKFFEPSVSRIAGMFLRLQFPTLSQSFEPLKFVSSYMCNSMVDIVNGHGRIKNEQPVEDSDFLDYIQSIKDKNLIKNRNNVIDQPQNNEGLSLRQMVGLSLGLLMTGSHTLFHTIIFTIHLLALHPEIQNQIRKEVDEVLKKHGAEGFDYNVVQDLQFTLQCLHETLRLYPFQSYILRQCSEDIRIPGTKYTIRKGDRIIVVPYSMHRDAKNYKNPIQFDPGRFSSERVEEICPDVNWNFGAGVRKCPGMKQGLTLTASFVAALVHKYEIQPYSHQREIEATDFHPRGFINFNKKDLRVRIVPR